MATDKREWSVPAPLRALLWWPFVAFVLVLISPDNATTSIVASGAVLIVVGTVIAVLRKRLVRPAVVVPVRDDHPTVELPTIQMRRTA